MLSIPVKKYEQEGYVEILQNSLMILPRELLVKCNLLVKRNFGDGITRYESSYNRKNHDHLICINCGTITEFTSPKIQEIVNQVCEEFGYENAGYSFNIFGKCKAGASCKNLK